MQSVQRPRFNSRQFGIEQEHFIFHADSKPPSHEEIDQLWDGLQRLEYRTRTTNRVGQVLSVQRDLPEGELVVTNDCCTHIIEVAFPPFRSLTRFRQIYSETWTQLKVNLSELGLAIKKGGTLQDGVKEVFWRPKDTDPDGKRLFKIISRPRLIGPLFNRDFLACFAASQVNLGVQESEAVQRLPGYYDFEFFVPLWFSNSPTFQNINALCVRPLAWEANIPLPYPLLGVPLQIPRDMSEYAKFRADSPFRDYSFVAIRGENRLEFRSACSQPSVEMLEQLIRFRLAVDEAVRDGVRGSWCPRTAFENACWGKPVEVLSEAADLLRRYFERFEVRQPPSPS